MIPLASAIVGPREGRRGDAWSAVRSERVGVVLTKVARPSS
jgi:hypothetical protein